MTALVLFLILGFTMVLAIAARGRRKGPSSTADLLVADRRMPTWLVYFLACGEIYSVGSLLGFPGGIYAKGANYAFWFMGYILLAYALGYFIGPLVWRFAAHYGALTFPDAIRAHYNSRALEVLIAVGYVASLVPWAEYQFVGLRVTFAHLGINWSPYALIALAAGIAFVYVAISGVRGSAYVAVVKDLCLVLAIVIVGVAVLIANDGLSTTMSAVPMEKSTLSQSGLVFAMSTIVLQVIAFYVANPSGQFLFPARSENAVRRSIIWMPLYMLMYPLLIVVSYYGIAHKPDIDANSVFLVTALDLLPDWLVGLVAAGGALAAFLVLSGTALIVSGTITRNLLPKMSPDVERRTTRVIIAVFLVAAAVLAASAEGLMLDLLNLSFDIGAQLVPAFLIAFFVRRSSVPAIIAGLAVGVAVVAWADLGGLNLGDWNSGLVGLVANALVVLVVSALLPKQTIQPIATIRNAARPADSPETVGH